MHEGNAKFISSIASVVLDGAPVRRTGSFKIGRREFSTTSISDGHFKPS
ncbi:unnamed protein product [Chondrus crispus]|uniref:Uncharacterized protein n=1 Tax=Chondrus crispus TaxID=2769 RepID=R7Q937_CHOCR|nr:unnamed protein product [Chondrus crispus]CDF34328.1 unnamed protein product [Chondrus crispus]|eukprot:XP_005714147.1 unnamed protein product [Chondrus crispus]